MTKTEALQALHDATGGDLYDAVWEGGQWMYSATEAADTLDQIDQEKPRARKAATWPLGLVRCWLGQIEDKDFSGAVLSADQIGALYYLCGSHGSARAFAAPLQVAGMPERIVSACRDDGKWIVMDSVSGAALCWQRARSRSKAESDARQRTQEEAERRGMSADAWLSEALARAQSQGEESEARAAWCKARNIADPREIDPAAAIGANGEEDLQEVNSSPAEPATIGPFLVMADSEKTAGEATTIEDARELARNLAAAEPFPCTFTIHGPDGEWIEDGAISEGLPRLRPGTTTAASDTAAELRATEVQKTDTDQEGTDKAAPTWNPPETVDVESLDPAEVAAWTEERFSVERDALEEINLHTEAAALDAMRHGTPEHVAEALAIVAAHLAAGHLTADLSARRAALVSALQAHRAAADLTPAPAILHATRPRLVQGVAYRLHVLADAVQLVKRAADAAEHAPWVEALGDGELQARMLARHAGEISAARGPAKRQALQITLTRAEGRSDECGKPATADSFAAADAILRAWSETAPASGAYDKCDFCITWPNGDEYHGRYDLKHHSAEAPSLTRYMIDMCDWHAGRAAPEHMTQAAYMQHLERIAEETRAAYAAVEQRMREASAWREIARPVPVDLRALMAAGVRPADLVGVGVRFTGGRGPYAGTPGGSGAITDAQDHGPRGLLLVATLEDGRVEHLDADAFMDGSHRPARYRIDWKRHGAPYLAELAAAVAMREASKTSAQEMARQAREAERVRLLAEYPDLERVGEAKGDSLNIAARNVRRLLSARWPGAKFSARIERFSMGNSLRIRWTDGPAPAEVDEIAGQFQAGSFDGMTDSYTYTRTTWGDMFGTAKYINTSRDLSDDAIAAVIAQEWGEAAKAPTVADYRGSAWELEEDRRRIYRAARQWSAPATNTAPRAAGKPRRKECRA